MHRQVQLATTGNLWLSLRDHHHGGLGERALSFDTIPGRLRRATISIDRLNDEIARQTTTRKDRG